MASSKEGMSGGKPSTAEKAALFYRNFNIVGAVALGGLAIIAPPAAAVVLTGLAGIDVLQAGAGEVARRAAKKSRAKKAKKAK